MRVPQMLHALPCLLRGLDSWHRPTQRRQVPLSLHIIQQLTFYLGKVQITYDRSRRALLRGRALLIASGCASPHYIEDRV